MPERIIPTVGRNNCGGRCLLYAHVEDGQILRMTTERPEDCPGQVPLTACARGLHYHKTFLSPDRLTSPLLRIGRRGEGRFAPISWEEAVQRIADGWQRIYERYGPQSRYVNYATGVESVMPPSRLARRLLSLTGGYLGSYNNYSNACIVAATELMYGTPVSGSSPETWDKSRLILLWGHNPAETHFDAQTMVYLRKARRAGVKIVVLDPRRSDTVRALDAEWVPLRPGTDSALADAMAWVILTEGLADRAFLDTRCVGFDDAHLPAGATGESVEAYLRGKNDGVEKNPRWGETITGVPAETIRRLAVKYATAKPGMILQGYGAQRHAYGEQSARGAILLACMTGNVGVPGGGAAGVGFCPGHAVSMMPVPENPCRLSIPVFRWTDAAENGRSMTARQGVRGGERLECDIKMILNLAGNCLINQHGDINRTADLLRDENKVELIICSDLFMTPSARFADIVLPSPSLLESEDIVPPWVGGDFIGVTNRIVEPLPGCREEYDWLSDVAERLGVQEEFTCGLTREQWLRRLYAQMRRAEPELPEYEQLKKDGVYRYALQKPFVAFAAQREGKERFPTPSGKVELYSMTAQNAVTEEYFPPIPQYVAQPEGYGDPLSQRYPLQLISWHTKARCHSVHANDPDLAATDPQRLWIHPSDAEKRSISTGNVVTVTSPRGSVRLPAFVTDGIMAGTVAMAQGAWYAPDSSGTDDGACVNVLTSLRATPYARGNGQHTCLAQVRK